MEIGKAIANRGVERNKKPLKNIVYEVTIKNDIPIYGENKLSEHKYKFKDLGYLILHWWYDTKNSPNNFYGYITPAELKQKLGVNQWAKFCQGKRLFVIQRRVDGKNVKKK